MQCSARHKRRLVKEKKEEYLERLNDVNGANDAIEYISEELINNQSARVEISEQENLDEPSIHNPLAKELGQWQLKSRTSMKNMRELLAILRTHGVDVPLSPSTLLEKTGAAPSTSVVHPGRYMHFGIENNLLKAAHLLQNYDEVLCDINIDGLPIFKSSKTQLWPILIKVVNIKNIKVFPAGVYVGKQKPYDVTQFLEKFVKEVSHLQQNDIQIESKKIIFKIRAVICDAPAKALICGIAYHSSANGCSKCTQIAKKIGNVLVYSTEVADIISDEDFANRKYKEQHQVKFINTETPLEKININMITQVPLDPMHVIDLGVTRKMLNKLFYSNINERVSNSKKLIISKLLISFKKHMTKDFTRLPRTLDELSKWKATEFRQFLLYTGIVALKNNVNEDFYYIFLLLHCAIRLLSCPKNFQNNIQAAEELLKLFVENFSAVFGPQSVTYNVHSLLHICACVKQHGLLYNFSAYDFENHLQMIKKDVRKPTGILQQLQKRNMHQNLINDPKSLGLKEKSGIIYGYLLDEYFLSVKSPNNICLVMPFTPFSIVNFKREENNEIVVIGRRFQNINPLFEDPINSLSALGICIADNVLEDVEETFNISTIHCKLLSLPFENKVILIPILHSCV